MPFFPNYERLLEQIDPSKKYSKAIFDFLSPNIAESLYDHIISKKRKNRGRKPDKELIATFLRSLFHTLDNAPKIESLETCYNISRGSYYRLLKELNESGLLKQFHGSLLNNSSVPGLLLLDAAHIRLVNGSEGVGYGYKEHSKKALKITIVTGTNKVIYFKGIHPDNLNDHTCFEKMSQTIKCARQRDVLADRGYCGERFKTVCNKRGYNIITPAKKSSRSGPSPYEKILLKKYRYRVEHVFSQLKRFRALQVKYNRLLWTFSTMLELGILIISIHNGIIKGGLIYSH